MIILDKPKSFGKQNQLYAVLKRGTPYIICANCNTPKRKKLQSNGRRWTLSLVQQSKAELFMNCTWREISFFFDNSFIFSLSHIIILYEHKYKLHRISKQPQFLFLRFPLFTNTCTSATVYDFVPIHLSKCHVILRRMLLGWRKWRCNH